MYVKWLAAAFAVFALAACDGGPQEQANAPAVDAPAGETEDPVVVTGPERRILAFGDSLFAGYNVGREESYPAQLEDALRGRGINAVVVNAGVSGDTSAAGRQRLDFVLDNEPRQPDLVILELGGNDLLRGIDPDQTEENLAAMLDMLRERGLPTLLVGLRAPPNLGADFVRQFDAIYPALAEKYDVDLVPFFLEPIYDQPDMIQSDRIHPTAEGIGIIVDATVDDVARALPPAETEAGS